MTDTVLCVDIGTTSLKSGLITEDGEVVSFYTYRFQNPCDRFIANQWLDGLNISVRRLVDKADGCYHIAAISVSGNGPTVVLPSGITVRWNEKTPVYEIGSGAAGAGGAGSATNGSGASGAGTATTAGKTTGSDRTATTASAAGEAGPGAQTITLAKRSLFLPKLLAIKNLFPREFERSQYVFSGPEYLIYQLTGNAVTVLPEGRFESAYWNNDVLAAADIPVEKLPPYIGVGQLCGNVTEKVIYETNLGKYLDKGIPVFSAGPDFVAALIGTNTLQAGKLCDRSGSSEGFNFCVPDFIVHEGARSLPSVIPGLWNISVLTPSSSKLSTEKRLHRVAESVNRLKIIAKENNIDFPDSMVVTGGQAKSNEYMIKKARMLKMNLIVSNCIDSELIGDACCGWIGLGRYISLQEAAGAIFKKRVVYEGL